MAEKPHETLHTEPLSRKKPPQIVEVRNSSLFDLKPERTRTPKILKKSLEERPISTKQPFQPKSSSFDFFTFEQNEDLEKRQILTLDNHDKIEKILRHIKENKFHEQAITFLHISDPLLTDDDFKLLTSKFHSFTHIKLDNCALLTQKSYKRILKKVENLIQLDLTFSQNSHEKFPVHLLQGFFAKYQNITHLALNNYPQLPAKILKKFIKNQAPHLKYLSLNGIETFNSHNIRAILRHSTNLVCLSLRGAKLSDQGSATSSHPAQTLNEKIKFIDLSNIYGLRDEFLIEIVKRCPVLEDLDLSSCFTLTNIGITQLCESCPNITHLNLSNIKNLRDYIPLSKLKNLKSLNLSEIKGELNETLTAFFERPKIINSLNLCGLHELTSQTLDFISDSLRRVEELHLDGIQNLTNEHITQLARNGLSRLKLVSFYNNPLITIQAIKTILEKAQNLESIHIKLCKNISEEVITDLARQTRNLKELSLVFMPISQDSLRHLFLLSKLEKLNLSFSYITLTNKEQFYQQIHNLEHLTELNLQHITNYEAYLERMTYFAPTRPRYKRVTKHTQNSHKGSPQNILKQPSIQSISGIKKSVTSASLSEITNKVSSNDSDSDSEITFTSSASSSSDVKRSPKPISFHPIYDRRISIGEILLFDYDDCYNILSHAPKKLKIIHLTFDGSLITKRQKLEERQDMESRFKNALAKKFAQTKIIW